MKTVIKTAAFVIVIIIVILPGITNLNEYIFNEVEVIDLPENPYTPPVSDKTDNADNADNADNTDTTVNIPEAYTPTFTAQPLPNDIIEFITGRSFKDNTPFGFEELVYLTMSYINFDGERAVGNMIVAASLGDEVLEIFKELYEAEFPIANMRLIDYYDANDILSMEANNTHSFNFRYIAGTTRISRHGFGAAIDINPVQNPYIRDGAFLPLAGINYLDRENIRPGMIIKGCVVYNAFKSRGWIWGGDWTSPIDYHHFEKR
jgi:hypothetical protein